MQMKPSEYSTIAQTDTYRAVKFSSTQLNLFSSSYLETLGTSGSLEFIYIFYTAPNHNCSQ